MIDISGISLAYPGAPEPVLEDVRLDVAEGEFVSLIGPSGCGKSTLLRAIMGLQAPHAGAIRMDADASQVGFLFQDSALLPWRTAAENVALGLRAHGMAKKTAHRQAENWLASVGLAGLGHRYPKELSGGQRKRVSIAQVLALRPRVLLMDEPFSSLDAIVRRYLTNDLLGWVEGEQMTILMVTHDLDEAVSVSDRVVLLSGGPRAHIRNAYEIPIERPRHLARVRQHPQYSFLVNQLWEALAEEIEVPWTHQGTEKPALKVGQEAFA